MDSLVEIPLQRWPEIRDLFKEQRPHRIPAYYSLDNHLRYPNLVKDFGTKVYCPYGVIEDGTVMLINNGALFSVIILINNKVTDKLEQALLETKLLDRSKMIFVPWADSDTVHLVEKIKSQLGWVEKAKTRTEMFIKYKDSEQYPNLQCPPGVYTDSVQLKHVPRVADTWPHKHEYAELYFQKLLLSNLSYGVFSKEDDSLIAWVFVSEVGYITHLYCEENHRKKGYAEFLAKLVTNDELAKENDVFCYVVEGNVASMNLYNKIEYEAIGSVVWTFFTRDNNDTKKN